MKNCKLIFVLGLMVFSSCLMSQANCNCEDGELIYVDGQLICEKIRYAEVSRNGNVLPVSEGDDLDVYGRDGTMFYEPVPKSDWPIYGANSPSGNGFYKQDQSKIVSAKSEYSPYWSAGKPGSGRLRKVGVWSSENPIREWIGFTACFYVPRTGRYVIGLGADNAFRLRINGVPFAKADNSITYNFNYWHVFEILLVEGENYIEMEGRDFGGFASFGAEIYDASLKSLSAVKTDEELEGKTIFTTADLRDGGSFFDLGEYSGYSCPDGFALSDCNDTSFACIQKTQTVCEDCQSFELRPNKGYRLSFWSRGESLDRNLGIQLSFYDSENSVLNSQQYLVADDVNPSEWGNSNYDFVTPKGATSVVLRLVNQTNALVYFDDIRIIPENANALSYIYDPETKRLRAEFDENNFPTLYEYDQEGNLIRIKKETTQGVRTIQESRRDYVKQ